MRRDFRVARACATEAVRDFRLHEYAPFGWILAVQLLFIALVFLMNTTVGMATAGALGRLVVGDQGVHYPSFFLRLPSVAQRLEAFLYTLPGSVLIPLSLIRIQKPMDAALGSPDVFRARLKQAILPTLVASLANTVLLEIWQAIVNVGPVPIMKATLPGAAGTVVVWVIAVVVAFGVAALFIYIPIVSVLPGQTFRSRLVGGFQEGVRLFRHTVFFIFFFSWPALVFLFVTQLRTAFVLERMRPELVAILVAIYSILISVASYLIYASAARLHWAESEEPAESKEGAS